MANRELANFLKAGTTTFAKNTTWGKQTQNIKNSTKEGFSFRALFPTINILPGKGRKKKNQQLPKSIFHSGSRKGNKQEAVRGNNTPNKVLLGKKQ